MRMRLQGALPPGAHPVPRMDNGKHQAQHGSSRRPFLRLARPATKMASSVSPRLGSLDGRKWLIRSSRCYSRPFFRSFVGWAAWLLAPSWNSYRGSGGCEFCRRVGVGHGRDYLIVLSPFYYNQSVKSSLSLPICASVFLIIQTTPLCLCKTHLVRCLSSPMLPPPCDFCPRCIVSRRILNFVALEALDSKFGGV